MSLILVHLSFLVLKQVYNGILTDSPRLERLCGTKWTITDKTSSSQNTMMIKFQTDGSRSNRGFRLRYTSLQPASMELPSSNKGTAFSVLSGPSIIAIFIRKGKTSTFVSLKKSCPRLQEAPERPFKVYNFSLFANWQTSSDFLIWGCYWGLGPNSCLVYECPLLWLPNQAFYYAGPLSRNAAPLQELVQWNKLTSLVL